MSNKYIKKVILNEIRRLKPSSDNIQEIENYKILFYRMLDKVNQQGGEIYLDNPIFNTFEDVFGTGTLNKLFFKWLLKNNPKQIENALKELLTIKFHSDKCGSYLFDFIINSFDQESSYDNYVNVNVTILNPNDTELTILNTGEVYTIPDAMDIKEYWEVNNEVNDCIKENITNILTPKTGMYVDISVFDFDYYGEYN